MFDNSTPHLSDVYDSQIIHTIPFYNSFHDETIKIIKCINPNPGFWLDSGCGTGTLVQKACLIFPHTEFFLSDPSAGMLEQAKKKLENVNSDRVSFLAPEDTKDIPKNFDDKFDIITAIQSHHYLNIQNRVFTTERCFSILKKNGIYITFENTRPLTEKGIEINKNYWAEFQLNEGRDIEAVKKHLSRFDLEYFPITVEDHLKLLRETGFKVVELFWYSYMQSGYYCIK